jgi:methoxymalonate biosynthesis acyl carrier protein
MRYEDAVTVAASLEQFIREQFQVAPDDSQFSRQVHLWDSGYVDSIGVAEVIAFLEGTFRVTVPDEALFSPGFVNIEGIARIVCDLAGNADSVAPLTANAT